jgi:hypothetical protein
MATDQLYTIIIDHLNLGACVPDGTDLEPYFAEIDEGGVMRRVFNYTPPRLPRACYPVFKNLTLTDAVLPSDKILWTDDSCNQIRDIDGRVYRYAVQRHAQ